VSALMMPSKKPEGYLLAVEWCVHVATTGKQEPVTPLPALSSLNASRRLGRET
jgi:hypothetical protein